MTNTQVCLAGFGSAVLVLVGAAVIDARWGGENYWNYAFFVVTAAWGVITYGVRKEIKG